MSDVNILFSNDNVSCLFWNNDSYYGIFVSVKYEEQGGLDSGWLLIIIMKKALMQFKKELPSTDTPSVARVIQRDRAEENLANRLSEIFKIDKELRERAQIGCGIFWSGVGGCYLISLLVRYDNECVIMFPTYTEIV